MTDLYAVAELWKTEMAAARKTWTEHHTPQPATTGPEDELPTSFAIDFPAELGQRAAAAKFLSELAIRSQAGGRVVSAPVKFLRELAESAEHGEHGEVSAAGLDRDGQLAVRRCLYIAAERAGLYAEQGNIAVIQFARGLLSQWESFIRFQPPQPGARTGPYGEPLRQGAPAPGRVAWPE